MNYRKILLLGMLLVVLAACGQKGDLYLPDEEEESTPATEQKSE